MSKEICKKIIEKIIEKYKREHYEISVDVINSSYGLKILPCIRTGNIVYYDKSFCVEERLFLYEQEKAEKIINEKFQKIFKRLKFLEEKQ